ncbi:MAG: hypothetical protein COA69_09095 [Robiginitomaculum sp.]|nr:MAG: hypothetical protein COA69_09095 [Robiginitomaculum sp.]
MNTRLHNIFLAVILLSSATSVASADDAPVLRRIHPTLEIYEGEAADICDPLTTQVRITVNGSLGGGMLTLELYNDPKHFLSKKGRIRRVRVPSVIGTQTVCINESVTGSYAVAGYHDIDGNRKLKKKWNKAPREPFALSNNPYIKELHFPKFSESAFELIHGGTNITIELIDLKKQKRERKAARKKR